MSIAKSDSQPLSETRYVYNMRNQVVCQQEAIIENGRITGWASHHKTYSSAGLLIEEQNDLSSFVYEYDNGRLASILSDKKFSIKYGENGKIKSLSAKTENGTYKRKYQYYGELVDRVAVSDPGLNSLYDKYSEHITLSTKRARDDLKQVKSETFCLHKPYARDPEFTIYYKRDFLGRVTELSGPGFKLCYEYDGIYVKRISRKDHSGNTLYSHTILKRDLSGNILGEKLIGNIGKRITEWSGSKASITTDYFLQRRSATSFSPKSPLNIETSLNSDKWSEKCEFDALGQITSERGLFNHTFSYAPLFNAFTEDSKFDGYRLISNESLSLEYENGHIIRKTTDNPISYKFDPFGQLSKDDQNEYFYDGFGRRILKVVRTPDSIKKYWYLYLGSLEIGMLDENFELLELRVPLDPNTLKNESIAFELQGEVFAPIYDLKGNVIALIDEDREIAESYQYSVFGKERVLESISDSGRPINPWRFAGHRTDESGLIFFGARYYDPGILRWISPDSLGTSDYPNPYAYLRNNPLKYYDPLGYSSEIDSELDQFFFGEVEPQCLCETHRNCKRGGCLNIGNIPAAIIRSSWNWILEGMFNEGNYHLGKMIGDFDEDLFFVHPAQERNFVRSLADELLAKGNKPAADLFPADESSREYQIAFKTTDIGMTILSLIDLKAIGSSSSKGLQKILRLVKPLNRKIAPYKDLRKYTRGLKGAYQAHHLLEVRHQKNWHWLKSVINSTPSVLLSRAEHEKITRSLRKKMPYKVIFTQEDVLSAIKEVYADHPEWIEAVVDHLSQ